MNTLKARPGPHLCLTPIPFPTGSTLFFRAASGGPPDARRRPAAPRSSSHGGLCESLCSLLEDYDMIPLGWE